jgi:cytidylate kinase
VRDLRDSERAASPLKAADDAIMLDSTQMSIEQVVAAVLGAVETRS